MHSSTSIFVMQTNDIVPLGNASEAVESVQAFSSDVVNVSPKLLEIEGLEVRPAKDYGIGLDCHKSFVQVSVIVQQNDHYYEYRHEFPTDWTGICTAREWCRLVLQQKADPPIIDSLDLHYCLESTASYHEVVLRAWKGIPSVINPQLADAAVKKSDVIDATRLASMDLTGIWKAFYVPSDDVSALRVLIAEHDNYSMLATRASNRINSTLLRFGITVSRDGSVTRSAHVREIVQNLISDNPKPMDNICPTGLPAPVKVMLREEYSIYDQYRMSESLYLDHMLDKAFSMSWETRNGWLSGSDLIPILNSVPGVGNMTSVIWLANTITPTRFPTAKACSAYCGLDPSVQISAKHVTGRYIRKGNKALHSALVQSASILIKNHTEMFGRWGYQLYLQTGRWRKAVNAVARKLSVALYYVNLYGVPFSYEKYNLLKEVVVMDIPVDELPLLNPDFKRYVKVLKEHNINTTSQLATAYYSYEVAKFKGVGKKFHGLMKDFVDNQKTYRDKYKELHPQVESEGSDV